jgi:preprotein translocase subunit YajC
MNFITPAYAQAVGAAGPTDFVMQLVPFAVILVIMYFMIMRPQQKRAKAHQDMISNVRRGDTVVTAGGMIAKVSRTLDDAEVEVDIAQGVKVRMLRTMISDERSKGEPVKERRIRPATPFKAVASGGLKPERPSSRDCAPCSIFPAGRSPRSSP